ncbi:hypothetical protein SLE2022_013720 [Rubroshorea leprosula]
MEFDIQIVSKETIKPSSPTPSLLRQYQLSFLDQIQPPIFMPLVMFYPRSQNNEDPCENLKKSLSQTLSIFYPLAGRIKDNTYIDCNDEGVYFLVAKANCHLSDILDRRDPGNNNKIISLEFDAAEIPAMVQLTFFQCGGLGVFFRMSHRLGDALSFLMFINCWAAIARGDDTKVITPRFESANIFPPKNISVGFPPLTSFEKNIMTKRFVFDGASVASLRDKYTKNGVRPSRVEALSTFIWSRFMATMQARSDPVRLYNVINVVNLRPRMDPPLSDYYFGNISHMVGTEPEPFPDREDGFDDIGNKVRDTIKKVNAESVKKLQEHGIGGPPSFIMEGDVVSLAFTSLCRFPFYEADFGWGKPEWVGSVSLIKENVVVFFDTKSGDGIEAWINLEEEDMVKFENDKEILSYV